MPCEHTPPQAIADELEALRALYGDHAVVSTTAITPHPPVTTVAITLPSAPPATLSTRLDHAAYPTTARPRAPTLRVPGLRAAACAELLAAALRPAPDGHPVGLPGEVCLFDYCEAVTAALSSFPSSLPLPGAPDPAHSSTATRAATHPPAAGANGTFDNLRPDGDTDADRWHAAQRARPRAADPDSAPELTLVHGEAVTDRRSVFQAHVAALPHGRASLAPVLRSLRSTRKGAAATHHTWALRLRSAAPASGSAGGGAVVEECDDDGEKGAGRVVLDVARHAALEDAVVVVSRWFGGVKLGPVRFRHIGHAARDAIDAWIAVQPKEETRAPHQLKQKHASTRNNKT